MQEDINGQILNLLPHIGAGAFHADEEKLKETQKNMKLAGAEGVSDNSSSSQIKNENKVGRNDPCPCGAKKEDGTPIKYKHCHGK